MHGLYSAILKSLTSRYALYGAQITSVLVLARIFEPRDFGVLAAVQVFVVLFQMLAEGGLGPAIISRDKITPEDRDGIFSATVLIGLCMAVCFAILGPALQAFYKMEGISTVALILSMSLIPTAALTFPQAALLKEQFYFRVSAAGIIAEALSLFLVFGLHRFSGLAPIKMLSLKTLTMASMNFLCLYAFSSKTTTGRPGPSRRISAIRPLLSFSLYQFGFNLLVFSSRNTDNILVGKFMSAGALGIYDRAYQLMRYPLMLLTFAMTPAIQPMLRKHASDSVYIENVHRSFTLRLSWIGVPAGLILSLSSEWVVRILLGSNWLGVAPVIRILALSIPVQVVLSTSGSFFQTMNRTDMLFVSGIASTILMIAAMLFGVVHRDLAILCWALDAAFYLSFLQSYYIFYRYVLRMSPAPFFRQFLLPVLILAVGGFYVAVN